MQTKHFEHPDKKQEFIECLSARTLHVNVTPGDPGASPITDIGIDLENSSLRIARERAIYPSLYMSMSQRTGKMDIRCISSFHSSLYENTTLTLRKKLIDVALQIKPLDS
ncbi:hypothetical protein JTB14_030258 [Gonioctena quinquepunctata]|nr:hypothetical protein JTB14_030258 [Gonioctena quinquepunctata]